MQIARVAVRRFRRDKEGQDLLERGLLAALLAVFAFGRYARRHHHRRWVLVAIAAANI